MNAAEMDTIQGMTTSWYDGFNGGDHNLVRHQKNKNSTRHYL